jgi:hypothetical protein
VRVCVGGRPKRRRQWSVAFSLASALYSAISLSCFLNIMTRRSPVGSKKKYFWLTLYHVLVFVGKCILTSGICASAIYFLKLFD